MKSKLPKLLCREINRLATEEMRIPTLELGKSLRREYQTRLLSGESMESLSIEVRRRTAELAVDAMCTESARSVRVSARAGVGNVSQMAIDGRIEPRQAIAA
jgi:hypothetical protein